LLAFWLHKDRIFNRQDACLRLPVAPATQTGADTHRQAKNAKTGMYHLGEDSETLKFSQGSFRILLTVILEVSMLVYCYHDG